MGFSTETVLALLKQKLAFVSDEVDGDFLLNMDARDALIDAAEKRASVLIALIEREGGLCVILTKRTENLNSHSGQVAFPGGKIDEDDASPEAAALREAWEEIGLDINEVEILGRLPDYYSGSRFIIAPVVGFVNLKQTREFREREWVFYEMPYEGHYIWGVTAGMIRVLYNRVFA